MVMTDPVADFLTRIRNGNMVMHETVEAPSSKIKVSIAEIMKEEGYIKDYEYIQDGKQGIIRVYLKYGPNKEKVITGIKRISKANREQIACYRILGEETHKLFFVHLGEHCNKTVKNKEHAPKNKYFTESRK
jgi:ribosomal protein S8